MARLLSLLLTLSLCVWLGGAASAVEPASPTPASKADLLQIQNRVRSVLPGAKRSTVAILGEGAGSGVIISPDGYVLTAGHVSGEPGKRLRVILADGHMLEGVALGKIDMADAGMIKLPPGRYPSASMARDEAIPLGEWCLAVGHPGGRNPRRGPVARIGRIIWKNRTTMCSDCKLIGGDSGGPLFNLKGEVIGIHSRISKNPDQNYHVPVSAFRHFWKDLVAWQDIDRQSLGFLGVRLSEHDGGMLVTEVVPDSPAQKARIREGDLITHLAKQPVESHHAVFTRMRRTKPREALPLRLRRGESVLALTVKLGARRPLM